MDKDQNNNLLSLIKSLNEFSEERGEIVNEIISIMKSIITRLSALETTVHHIELTMITNTERASFLELIDNLQEQVEVLAKGISTKEK